jgi:hypothetical protein
MVRLGWNQIARGRRRGTPRISWIRIIRRAASCSHCITGYCSGRKSYIRNKRDQIMPFRPICFFWEDKPHLMDHCNGSGVSPRNDQCSLASAQTRITTFAAQNRSSRRRVDVPIPRCTSQAQHHITISTDLEAHKPSQLWAVGICAGDRAKYSKIKYTLPSECSEGELPPWKSQGPLPRPEDKFVPLR